MLLIGRQLCFVFIPTGLSKSLATDAGASRSGGNGQSRAVIHLILPFSYAGLFTRWTCRINPADLGNAPSGRSRLVQVPNLRAGRKQSWKKYTFFFWVFTSQKHSRQSKVERGISKSNWKIPYLLGGSIILWRGSLFLLLSPCFFSPRLPLRSAKNKTHTHTPSHCKDMICVDTATFITEQTHTARRRAAAAALIKILNGKHLRGAISEDAGNPNRQY